MIHPTMAVKGRPAIHELVVLCFFGEVVRTLVDAGTLLPLSSLTSEMGVHPVYEYRDVHTGQAVAVMHQGVGAPLAAAFVEEAIALGGRSFIACGGAGVLRPDTVVGHLVVPETALRDEGTSYHYLPAAREVAPTLRALEAIKTVMQRHSVPYVTGKTWTTDAIYRETKAKVASRLAEGCLTVEMEASALFAVARFRGVELAQILYGGDDVSGDVWDARDWHKQRGTREKLFWLAMEAVVELASPDKRS